MHEMWLWSSVLILFLVCRYLDRRIAILENCKLDREKEEVELLSNKGNLYE